MSYLKHLSSYEVTVKGNKLRKVGTGEDVVRLLMISKVIKRYRNEFFLIFWSRLAIFIIFCYNKL